MVLNSSLYKSNKEDWETPFSLFSKLNDEFKFILDVCATSTNKKCEDYFTIQDDGLKQNWGKGPVWMNPPYGRSIKFWVEKAYNSFCEGCLCVCLLPVRSDTKWWHQYVMKASEIRLLNKRLSFVGSNNKAPFPAAIVVFDPMRYNTIQLTSLEI